MTPDSLLPVPESASECENVSSPDLLAVVNDYNADIDDEENCEENDDEQNENENENEGLSPANNYLSTTFVSPPSQPSPASPSSPVPQSFLSSLLPYIPANYSWRRDLLVDVIAGVSVAAMMVPQSISFITLSDLPLNFGLHATLIAAFSYSVLGGRSPFAASAYIMKPAVQNALGLEDPNTVKDDPLFIDLMLLTLFMTGCFLILLGVTKIGAFLGKILHPSFISAFTTSTAFIIISSQLNHLFFNVDANKRPSLYGINMEDRSISDTILFFAGLGAPYQKVIVACRDLFFHGHGPTILLSLVTLLLMKLLNYGPKLWNWAAARICSANNNDEEDQEGTIEFEDDEMERGPFPSAAIDIELGAIGHKSNYDAGDGDGCARNNNPSRLHRKLSIISMSRFAAAATRPRSFSLPAAFNCDWGLEGDVPEEVEAFGEEYDGDDATIGGISSFSGRRQSYWTNGDSNRRSFLSCAISEAPELDQCDDDVGGGNGFDGDEKTITADVPFKKGKKRVPKNIAPFISSSSSSSSSSEEEEGPRREAQDDQKRISELFDFGDFSKIQDNFNTVNSTLSLNPKLLKRMNERQWDRLRKHSMIAMEKERQESSRSTTEKNCAEDKAKKPDEKKKFQIPDILITLVILTLISFLARLQDQHNVLVLGKIDSGLPSPSVSFFTGQQGQITQGMVLNLLVPSIMLSILTFVLSISVGMAYAKDGGYVINPTREAVAIGLSNLLCAFFQGFLCAGGLSRAAVLKASGAKSHIATWISCFIVMATLLWLTPLFYHVPKPVLGMIVCLAMVGSLKNLLKLRSLWESTCSVEYVEEMQKRAAVAAAGGGRKRRKPVKLVLMQTAIPTWPKSIFGERLSFHLFLLTFLALTVLKMEYGVALGVLLCLAQYLYVILAKRVSKKRARRERRESIADFVKRSAQYVRDFEDAQVVAVIGSKTVDAPVTESQL